MKHINILISFLLLAGSLYSQQTFEWGVTAGGSSDDLVNDILHFDNHIYVTGNFTKNFSFNKEDIESKGLSDIYIAKLDKNGNAKWLKRLGGKGADQAVRMASGKDCILMAGEISGPVYLNKNEFAGENRSVFIASWSSSGKINWLTRVNYSGNLTLDVLEVSADGSIVAGGMISGTLTVNNKVLDSKPGRRAYLLNLSKDGKLIDGNLSQGKGGHRLVAASFGADDTCYLLFNVNGWINYGKNPEKFTQNEDFRGLVLVKEKDQQIEWTKYIKGSAYVEGVQLAVNSGNDVLTCINYSNTLTLPDTTISTRALQDIAIVNYSDKGERRWLKQLKSPVVCYAMDALQTRNGKLLVTGYFRDVYSYGDNEILADNTEAKESMFLAQLDKNGNLSWHDEPGKQASAFSKSLTIGKQGDIFMAGGFKNSVSFNGKEIEAKGKTDVLVAKYFNCEQLEVEINDVAPLCEGTTLDLNISNNSFESFLWNDSVWGENYTVYVPGEYTVEAFNKKGCSTKDSITVVRAELPNTGLPPEINLKTNDNVVLLANSGFAQYWWSNGKQGPECIIEHNPELDTELYVLTAESFDGCILVDSVTVNYLHQGTAQARKNASALKVYPNPVKDKLSWYYLTQKPIGITLKLFDEKGVLIYSENMGNYLPGTVHQINMANMAGGHYTLSLKIGEKYLNEKIVKK